jgi:chromosome segregation ATPase
MKKRELSGFSTGSNGCPGKIEVPTEKEQAILAAMKAVKDRVRQLKQSLKSMQSAESGSEAELAGAEQELARLKVEWDSLDERRKKAARERMIQLGHEEPDS